MALDLAPFGVLANRKFLRPYHEAFNASFPAVVVDFKSAVEQERAQLGPLIATIVNSGCERAFRDDFQSLLVEPFLEAVEQGFTIFESSFVSLGSGAVLEDFFDLVEIIAILKSDVCGRRMAGVFAGGWRQHLDRFIELAACVRPAADEYHLRRKRIVCIIGVDMQVTLVFLEEVLGMLTGSGHLIIKEDDWA